MFRCGKIVSYIPAIGNTGLIFPLGKYPPLFYHPKIDIRGQKGI